MVGLDKYGLIGHKVESLRHLLFTIWLCLSTLLSQSAVATPMQRCPSNTATESSLSAFFHGIEQIEFAQYYEVQAQATKPKCADWLTDATAWLRLSTQETDFRQDGLKATVGALGFLAFEGYRIDQTDKTNDWHPIEPFDHPRFISLNRLPHDQPNAGIQLILNLPARGRNQSLALSVKGPHEVFLSGQRLEPRQAKGPYFLDNALYDLPKSDTAQVLIVLMKPTDVYRKLAARVLTTSEVFSPEALLKVTEIDSANTVSNWREFVWAMHRKDTAKIRSFQGWLREEAQGQRPWRFALALLKINALDVRHPSFLPPPLDDEDHLWWTRYQYEMGQHALDHGRLKIARAAQVSLSKDSRSESAAVLLNAQLLDDAGLSGSAAAQVNTLPNTVSMKRVRQQFLANAELTHQRSSLLQSLANADDASRNDVHNWLSWLFRAGQFDAFERTRARALTDCTVCWRRFEAFGGLLFPPMSPKDLKTIGLVRPDGLPTTGPAQLMPDTDVIHPITARSDDFFAQPLPTQTIEKHRAVRNARLEQTVHVTSSGLSRLHERRILVVNAATPGIELALEYVPNRQHVVINRAHIIRDSQTEIMATEVDESTDHPRARLYYDTRRRLLIFKGLQRGDRIEVDWSVVDETADPELPGLDGWVFPLNDVWPTDDLTIKWTNRRNPFLAQISTQPHRVDGLTFRRSGLSARTDASTGQAGMLILSNLDRWSDLDTIYLNTLKPRYAPTRYLHTVAKQIVGNARTPDQKLKRLFLAVQRQVNYVGLEIGGHSRTPEWIERVWRRKLGDCKDKAALLIGLAKSVGLTLDFVLVRTRRLPRIESAVPTLALFDHALVYSPRLKQFFDPNDPILGNAVLPAAVQGAQAYIVGKSDGLITLPNGKTSDETTHWHVRRIQGSALDWNVSLTLTGHAASAFVHEVGFNSRSVEAVQRAVRKRMPKWTLLSASFVVADSPSPRVELSLAVSTVSNEPRQLLTDFLSAKTAWLSQERRGLLKHHDLPRTLTFIMPMDENWHLKSLRRLVYDFGVVTLAEKDRELHLVATLNQPAIYLKSQERIAVDELISILEGEAP